MPTTTQAPPAEPAIIEPDAEIAGLIEKRVTSTTTGLIFSEETQFEEWEKIYATYSIIREKSNWFVGDCLRFGERFGEKYAQAVHITDKSYSYLTTICWVCAQFKDLERRREHLPFSWHEAVAALPPQTADKILDDAEKKHWSRDEVRDAAAKAKGLPTKAQKLAAKEAKANGGVKLLPPAANSSLPIIDIAPRPIVWNGYPLTLEDGVLFTGPEPLPDREAVMAAKDNGFPSVEAMTKALENQAPPTAPAPAPEPAKPAEVSTSPSVLPMPPATAQAPAPAQIEPDQHLAEQRCASALNILAESIKAVDWGLITPLRRKTWLKNLIVVDELIDLLQKP